MPDIGCSQIRFFVVALAGPVSLNSLEIGIRGTRWLFDGVVSGTYVAQDDFGSFGGFLAISPDQKMAAIDFLSTGAPFTLDAGSTGFLDTEVVPLDDQTDATTFSYVYSGVLAEGTPFGSSNVAPEPTSALLLATGIAGVALSRRRSRKANRSES